MTKAAAKALASPSRRRRAELVHIRKKLADLGFTRRDIAAMTQESES